MDSIHGHEVLNMMIESGEQYTHASLDVLIHLKYEKNREGIGLFGI